MPLYEPLIPARYALVLMQTVSELSPQLTDRWLAEAQLSRRKLQDPAAVLGIRQFDRLLCSAVERLGRSDLGFEFGLRLSLDDHAALGHALRRCRSGDELLRLIGRYWRLTTTCFFIRYRRYAWGGELLFRPVAPMSSMTWQVMEEMFAVSFNRDFMALSGQRAGLQMQLSQAPPEHLQRFTSLLPTGFGFAAGRLPQARCVIAPVLLDSPLQQPCNAIDSAASASRLQEDPSSPTRHCAELVRLLLQQAEGVQPDVHALAQWLNVSPRTLIRHLAAEGETLRGMGVSVRHQRACQMLAETRQPIGQIAERLGYGSVMAFSHAFKQLAGMSPRGWRSSCPF